MPYFDIDYGTKNIKTGEADMLRELTDEQFVSKGPKSVILLSMEVLINKLVIVLIKK